MNPKNTKNFIKHHTCSSWLDSLVSGYLLSFRTISVVELNPAAASTCTPSVSSKLAPAAMTVDKCPKSAGKIGPVTTTDKLLIIQAATFLHSTKRIKKAAFINCYSTQKQLSGAIQWKKQSCLFGDFTRGLLELISNV